jgi:hypothetical protein
MLAYPMEDVLYSEVGRPAPYSEQISPTLASTVLQALAVEVIEVFR